MALRPQTLKFIGLLTLVIASLIAFQVADLGRYIKPQAIRSTIQSRWEKWCQVPIYIIMLICYMLIFLGLPRLPRNNLILKLAPVFRR